MSTDKKTFLLPLVAVFCASMIVVTSTFYVSVSSVQQEREKKATELMNKTEEAVITRFKIYEEVLRSAAGIFAGSENVTMEEWVNYVEATKIKERYPGVQGIGYVKIVNDDELDNFLRQASMDTLLNFDITPIGERQLYAPVLYVAPASSINMNVVGYDMFSESVRKEAMAKATDTGLVTLSNAVTLVVEQLFDNGQYGFLMYAPQYAVGQAISAVDERRSAIEGYAYAAFRSEDFLNEVLLDLQLEEEDLSYQVKKPDKDGQLVSVYKTSQYDGIVSNNSTKITRSLNIRGSDWEFNYAYRSNGLLDESTVNRPAAVLFYGTILAALVSGVIYLLLRGKANELALAKERETNEAKDSLLSIASHQLRTPATGVKQYLGMVLQGFAGDTSKKQSIFLEKAYESNERQLKTINEVLYLARLDSGRIVLNKNRVDLQTIIISIIDEQKDSIYKKDHKVTTKMPKKLVSVEADEHMLRMAIENLMTNAIKYTREKGRITVTLKQEKNEALIRIKDNGVGISPDDIETVFKAFGRVPNELSQSVSGTGIGLYLARHLIELHGGVLSVDSELGLGSTFTIRIPKK